MYSGSTRRKLTYSPSLHLRHTEVKLVIRALFRPLVRGCGVQRTSNQSAVLPSPERHACVPGIERV